MVYFGGEIHLLNEDMHKFIFTERGMAIYHFRAAKGEALN
jgi:ribosomal protein S2